MVGAPRMKNGSTNPSLPYSTNPVSLNTKCW
jgi:hypothetical protein